MSVRLEEQIRRYTQTMDSQAAPLEELVPGGLPSDFDIAPGPSVEISVPLGPLPRRRRTPAWVYGLAAAVVVLLLAIPVWLFVSEPIEDVADTSPTSTTDPFLRAESEGVATGVDWPPSSPITFAVNGIEGDESHFSDSLGEFNFELASIGLSFNPGDTLTATDGTSTRQILIPVLTVDIFDPSLGVASGTTSLPDGTQVELRIPAPGGNQVLPPVQTTVQDGTWNFAFEPMTPDQTTRESWVSVLSGDGPYAVRLGP